MKSPYHVLSNLMNVARVKGCVGLLAATPSSRVHVGAVGFFPGSSSLCGQAQHTSFIREVQPSMHPLAPSGLRAQSAIYQEMLPCAACGAVLTRFGYVWIHHHCTHLCFRRENWELGTSRFSQESTEQSDSQTVCRPGRTCRWSFLPPPRTCRDRAGCRGPSTSAPSCTFWRRLWICVCQISQLNLVVAARGGDSGAGCDEWLSWFAAFIQTCKFYIERVNFTVA